MGIHGSTPENPIDTDFRVFGVGRGVITPSNTSCTPFAGDLATNLLESGVQQGTNRRIVAAALISEICPLPEKVEISATILPLLILITTFFSHHSIYCFKLILEVRFSDHETPTS